MSKGLDSRRYRTVRMRQKRKALPCHLCGQEIDYSPGDQRKNPWSFELDHIIPLSRGGNLTDPSNCASAHKICNQRKGNGTRPKRIDGSRRW